MLNPAVRARSTRAHGHEIGGNSEKQGLEGVEVLVFAITQYTQVRLLGDIARFGIVADSPTQIREQSSVMLTKGGLEQWSRLIIEDVADSAQVVPCHAIRTVAHAVRIRQIHSRMQLRRPIQASRKGRMREDANALPMYG